MPNPERWALIASPNDDYHDIDIRWAIIDMTPELANKLLQRVGIFTTLHAADPDLRHMEYTDYEAVWYTSGDDDETPGEEAPENETLSVVLSVDETTVWWTIYPRFSDVVIDSECIAASDLRRYLAGESVMLGTNRILILPHDAPVTPSDHQTEGV